MRKLSVLSLLFLLAFVQTSFAQKKKATLEIVGYAKEKLRVKDATVTVYDGNKVVQTFSTQVNGRFLLYLPFNKNYKITIEKEGFISLNFEVDATMPAGGTTENMTTDLDIKMIAQPIDGSKESFDKPVAKVSYIEKVGMFDYSWDYDDEIADEVSDLEKKIRNKNKAFEKDLKEKDSELAKADFEKDGSVCSFQ